MYVFNSDSIRPLEKKTSDRLTKVFQRVWSGHVIFAKVAYELLTLIDQTHLWAITEYRTFVLEHLRTWHEPLRAKLSPGVGFCLRSRQSQEAKANLYRGRGHDGSQLGCSYERAEQANHSASRKDVPSSRYQRALTHEGEGPCFRAISKGVQPFLGL